MSLRDGLIAYYKMDEAGGTRVDIVGQNNVTANGTVPAAAGVINSAGDFATGGVWLETASTADLTFGDEPLTINAHLRINAGTTLTNQGKVTKWNATGSDREYALLYRGSNQRWEFFVSHDGTAVATVTANTAGAPSVDTFYMVTAQHDPVANIISIRVDDGTADTLAHTTGINAGTTDFNIGRFRLPASTPSIGRIDEVGIWGRVLSDDEITKLHNGGNGLPFSAFGGETDQIYRRRSVRQLKERGNLVDHHRRVPLLTRGRF